MHEFAICQRIVVAALEEAALLKPPPVDILGIEVVIGGLHQIVPDYLQTAFKALTRDTVLDGSQLRVTSLPVRVQCRQCAWTGEIDPPVFCCRDCGDFRVDVRQGRELYLNRMEVEDDVVTRN